MKKLIGLLVAVLMVMPVALATSVGTGIGIDIEVEEFAPRIWLCDHRVVVDDEIQQGRIQGGPVCSQKDDLKPFDPAVCDSECCTIWEWRGTGGRVCTACPGTGCGTDCKEVCIKDIGCFLKGFELVERHNNYAFEGEKIEWKVLVMDKNKIEEIQEVVVTLGSDQGPGNDIEVECLELRSLTGIMDSCEARIDEEKVTWDDQIMSYYECTLTVETPDSMYDEWFVTIEALDTTGLSDTIDENEYWFFNPVIALSVDGDIVFSEVRPGTIAYSETLLVGNDADPSSGVMLDMFISGTDFYDLSSSGARCVLTNRLKLGDNYVSNTNNGVGGTSANRCVIGFTDTADHLCYFATSGAYSTQNDGRRDAEGYAPIVYGTSFSSDFYNDAEIIQVGAMGAYWMGNMLSPGSEMAVTFKLGLPLPCVGNFDSGQLFFWGEAV